MNAIHRRKFLLRSRTRKHEHEPEWLPECFGLLSTVFHEAAHCVLGVLIGYRILGARFDKGTHHGATYYQPSVRCPLLDLTFTLGGPVCEFLIVANPPARIDAGLKDDFSEARSLALKYLGLSLSDPGAPEAVVDLFERIQAVLRECLLEDPRVARAIDEIAAALLVNKYNSRNGELTRNQIIGPIDRHGARGARAKLREGLEAIRIERWRGLEAIRAERRVERVEAAAAAE